MKQLDNCDMLVHFFESFVRPIYFVSESIHDFHAFFQQFERKLNQISKYHIVHAKIGYYLANVA